MQLTVIGSGTASLQYHSGPSGYLLRIQNETCLLDGGTGTLLKCLKVGVSYEDIDNLFYTHLHPDHTIDLVPFLFATKHTSGFIRRKKLTIHGPIGFKSFFYQFVELFGSGMIEVEYEIEIHELSESVLIRDGWSVKTELMQHSNHAIGYRFEHEDKILVYSGDTDVCDGIVRLSRNADVLVIECSFSDDNKMTGHLTPSEVGEIASRAGAKRVYLTHIYPPFDEDAFVETCQRSFSGEVAVVSDFTTIDV